MKRLGVMISVIGLMFLFSAQLRAGVFTVADPAASGSPPFVLQAYGVRTAPVNVLVELLTAPFPGGGPVACPGPIQLTFLVPVGTASVWGPGLLMGIVLGSAGNLIAAGPVSVFSPTDVRLPVTSAPGLRVAFRAISAETIPLAGMPPCFAAAPPAPGAVTPMPPFPVFPPFPFGEPVPCFSFAQPPAIPPCGQIPPQWPIMGWCAGGGCGHAFAVPPFGESPTAGISVAPTVATEVLEVQPASAWTITPMDPMGCGIENPRITGVTDVATSEGPGIRSDAVGTTVQCCGCAFAERSFPLTNSYGSQGATLSFYYRRGTTGFYSAIEFTLTFLQEGVPVGSGVFDDERPSNCVRGQPVPNDQVVTLNLDDFLEHVTFDTISVRLNHYACVGTNFQIISNLTLGAFEYAYNGSGGQ